MARAPPREGLNAEKFDPPRPEKFHAYQTEMKYRAYGDLIMNPDTRRTFEIAAALSATPHLSGSRDIWKWRPCLRPFPAAPRRGLIITTIRGHRLYLRMPPSDLSGYRSGGTRVRDRQHPERGHDTKQTLSTPGLYQSLGILKRYDGPVGNGSPRREGAPRKYDTSWQGEDISLATGCRLTWRKP